MRIVRRRRYAVDVVRFIIIGTVAIFAAKEPTTLKTSTNFGIHVRTQKTVQIDPRYYIIPIR